MYHGRKLAHDDVSTTAVPRMTRRVSLRLLSDKDEATARSSAMPLDAQLREHHTMRSARLPAIRGICDSHCASCSRWSSLRALLPLATQKSSYDRIEAEQQD